MEMKTQQRALRSQQEAGRDESLMDYAEKMQALMKYKTLREFWKQVMAEDDALMREKLGEWGLSTRGSARHVKERDVSAGKRGTFPTSTTCPGTRNGTNSGR